MRSVKQKRREEATFPPPRADSPLAAEKLLGTRSPAGNRERMANDAEHAEPHGDGAAALMRSALLSARLVPPPRAITFFRPKLLRNSTSLVEQLRSKGPLSVVRSAAPALAANGAAGFALFNVHRHASNNLEGHASRGTTAAAAACGGIGGLVHACVVHPVQGLMSPGSAPLLRGLAAAMCRDGLGFAAFFSAWHWVERALLPHPSEEVATSTPRIREVGSCLVAGAAAGGSYHLVSHPLDATLDALRKRGVDPTLRNVAAELRELGPPRALRATFAALKPAVVASALSYLAFEAVRSAYRSVQPRLQDVLEARERESRGRNG